MVELKTKHEPMVPSRRPSIIRSLLFQRLLALSTVLLLTLPTLNADEIGKQVWLDVNPRWYSKDDLKVTGVFGVRQALNKNEWTRYVVKPSVAYSLSHGFDIGAGLGMNYTNNIDVDAITLPDRFAIVPFQGLNYVYLLTKQWKFNAYLRLEEKFDYDTLDWESRNSLRLRLRLRGIYEFAAYQTERYFRATLSWEGFKTAAGTDGLITDKSRITLGLERSFTHNQKGRVELTWQRQSLGIVSGDSFDDYSDIYLRVRYYPSWGDVIRNKFWHSD